MKGKLRTILVAIIAGLIVVNAIDVYGTWLMVSNGTFRRYAPVPDLDIVDVRENVQGATALRKDFKSKDYRVLLDQVMNSVGRIDSYTSPNAAILYDHVKNGGGLVCDGMSTLYFNALTLNGITARQVYMTRNILDNNDSHTSVEVFLDGTWVIVDPTFHVSFQKDGQLLGAEDIQEALQDGSFTRVHPLFYGEVRYPARLDTYYIHWLPLFNNVFLADSSEVSPILKLPPFRYWLGPKIYYEAGGSNPMQTYVFLNKIYFIFSAILPLITIAMTLLMAVMILRASRLSKRAEA